MTRILGPLAVALRADLDVPTFTLYARALADIPLPVLEAAAVRALQTRTWFPSVAELREDCDQVKPRVDDGPAPPPTGGSAHWFDCDVCRDTGWQEVPQERPQEGPSQPWVRRCACYGTNPTIQRHLRARASYAEQAAPAGRKRR